MGWSGIYHLDAGELLEVSSYTLTGPAELDELLL